MTVDINYIEKLTKEFMSESIRDQNPAGLCFPTSYLLQLYLATKKTYSDLIKGKVPITNLDGTTEDREHYWLRIKSTDIIIDATIQQFGNPSPIYVGKLLCNKITKTYIPNKLDLQSWFPRDFENWTYNYVRSEHPQPVLDEPYVNRSITYVIKLATILHEECKRLYSADEFITQHYGIYFQPIFIFLYNWHNKIIDFEIKKENMPTGFDNLLSDALKWADEERKKQVGATNS
ncbi:MAG: hypothetical protein KFKLKKLM_02126 [Flavobacteriales bacterium]|nr:hypothetical protein [Flavobacteriales bacterium]